MDPADSARFRRDKRLMNFTPEGWRREGRTPKMQTRANEVERGGRGAGVDLMVPVAEALQRAVEREEWPLRSSQASTGASLQPVCFQNYLPPLGQEEEEEARKKTEEGRRRRNRNEQRWAMLS